MEELTEQFTSGLNTEKDENQRYRLSQFKSHNFNISDQDYRRNLILDRQRSQRQSEIDARRGILDVVNQIERANESSRRRVYTPSIYIPGFHEKKVDLLKTLMLSEWLTDLPQDIVDNWVVFACPKGMRCLLVATRCRTKIYNKFGKLHKTWQSCLPGGSNSIDGNKKSCVLDCIWSEATKSVYVMDVLMWVNQPVTSCDMDFRDNWLRAKFSEYPELGEISVKNEHPIYLLPKYNCDKESFEKFLLDWPPFHENNPQIDGFLFYHKEAHYIGGITPVAGWLLPYMVNEVFGSDIAVHDGYLKMKPANYIDMEKFIEAFEEKQVNKQIHIERLIKKKQDESGSSRGKRKNRRNPDNPAMMWNPDCASSSHLSNRSTDLDSSFGSIDSSILDDISISMEC